MGRHFIWSASGLYFTSRTYLPISCHWSLFMPLKNIRKPLERPVTWNVLTRMFLNRVTQRFLKNYERSIVREKCPYLEFFWSVFSHIWSNYGEILCISPYSVRMRENIEQKNSEYVHFSHSTIWLVYPDQSIWYF